MDDLEKKKRYRAKMNLKKRERMYRWLLGYYKTHPCVTCGETDPLVLEFDHTNADLKMIEISKLVNQWSIEKIQEEVRKCVVRCANCHRRKTAIEQNWMLVDIIQAVRKEENDEFLSPFLEKLKAGG